ncbi:hypothetical protein [Acidocella sp.]|jgi:hypothetical protein|uniref:hypothetical protein n=1 Tax=Acidocella sp. TaxID=50710 RepID=UPI002F424EF5
MPLILVVPRWAAHYANATFLWRGSSHENVRSTMPRCIKEESGRFLKKSGAKIFGYAGSWAMPPTTPMTQINKVFLLLFVHKK